MACLQKCLSEIGPQRAEKISRAAMVANEKYGSKWPKQPMVAEPMELGLSGEKRRGQHRPGKTHSPGEW